MFEKLLIPFSIIIAGVIIASSVLFSSNNFSLTLPGWAKKTAEKSSAPPGQSVAPPPAASTAGGDDLGTNPPLGNKNAVVKIIEFGDYQCPVCERFFKTVEPLIKEELVNTGKAVFAFRDFIVIDTFVPSGHESKDAALAARCAGDQGKYWPYHDKLFEKQSGENLGAFKVENLKKFALDLKLNQADFNQCFSQRKYDAQIESDTNSAISLGAPGTPTLFINGQIFRNWSDFSAIKAYVDSLLNR